MATLGFSSKGKMYCWLLVYLKDNYIHKIGGYSVKIEKSLFFVSWFLNLLYMYNRDGPDLLCVRGPRDRNAVQYV